MNFNNWLAFIIACLIFSGSPGVGVLSTITNAVSKGMKFTVFSILGLEFSLIFYLLLVAVGLGAIISASAWIFNILKWSGVVYLIWFGVQKFKASSQLTPYLNNQNTSGYRTAFISGICVNLSNPKSIIFLAAFLPQFIDTAVPMLPQYLILGATMVTIDIIFHALYGFFANNARPILSKTGTFIRINRVFGLLFIGAGFLMAKANK